MRIVHVIDDARPIGGAQTYLARLCAGTASRGWNHRVVSGVAGAAPPGVDELRVWSGDPDADARLVLELEPDLVLLHNVDSAQLAVTVAKHARTVVYEHDYRHISPGNLRFWPHSESFCERGFGAQCLLKPYTQRCNNRRPDRVLRSVRRVQRWRGVLASLDGVLCASDAVARLVAGFAPDARISVVAYPIDVPAVGVRPSAMRSDLLYVGRTSEVKGIRHLLDAFALLVPRRPSTRLLMAAGPDLDEVREQVAARGLGDAVELLGWIEGDELVAAYERARVLAVPSVWPEPFGMAGPEALAFGIPVVGSDVGGISSWLNPARGALVPPGDPAALAEALGRYLADPALSDSHGAAGRAFVASDLSLDRHLERVVPIFEGGQ